MEWWMFLLIALALNVCYLMACIAMRENKMQLLQKVAVVFLFPFGGVLYFAISGLVFQLFYRTEKNRLSIEDLSFRKYKIKTVSAVNRKEEMDKVPLTEALLLADKSSRRTALLGILKSQKEREYLPLLMTSLGNEDSEVSHFAATSLNEITNRYREQEAALWEAAQSAEPPQKAACLEAYLNASQPFLVEGILSKTEQAQYEDRLHEMLKELVALQGEGVNGDYLGAMIWICIRRQQMERARHWIQTALALPDNLEVFKMALRYHHRMGDRDGFFSLLERVRESSLVLDGSMLDIIRFYGEEARPDGETQSPLPTNFKMQKVRT